jgi:hypothetical protein
MKDAVGGAHPRTSFKPRVEAAVVTLARAFEGEPEEPEDVVWRAFPMLDPQHRAALAQRLVEARAAYL